MRALRGAQSAAGNALRELPGTVLKHAVAPGMAVQTLEEAFPEKQSRKDPSESISDRSSGYSLCACSDALSWQADRPILI
jgi:hypothetical protein